VSSGRYLKSSAALGAATAGAANAANRTAVTKAARVQVGDMRDLLVSSRREVIVAPWQCPCKMRAKMAGIDGT
jgi:hypothetical protein